MHKVWDYFITCIDQVLLQQKRMPVDGEKRNLKNHLLAKDGCEFALIQCPNFCKNGCRSATLCLRKNLVCHLEHCGKQGKLCSLCSRCD